METQSAVSETFSMVPDAASVIGRRSCVGGEGEGERDAWQDTGDGAGEQGRRSSQVGDVDQGAEIRRAAEAAATTTESLPNCGRLQLQTARSGDRMVEIEMSTFIAAPQERVFDLSRSIDVHQRSVEDTGERAVGGRTSGLIELGESVTWRARHLGVTQHLTSRISGYDRPRWFQDEMVRGAFAWMVHDHWFSEAPGGCVLRDSFRFAAPLGPLGRLAEALLLRWYMRRFLAARNAVIKRVAESDAWREFVPGEGNSGDAGSREADISPG
jgi:ligand-binding SRPBCC domain-containing protein